MGAMDDDAPLAPTTADRLSRAAAPFDDAVNALHDDLNGRLPWLWWPLTAPSADARLDGPRHALYGAHAAIGLAAAGLLTGRRARPAVVLLGGVLAAASWALFTGAWDRRADALRADAWDAYDGDDAPSA